MYSKTISILVEMNGSVSWVVFVSVQLEKHCHQFCPGDPAGGGHGWYVLCELPPPGGGRRQQARPAVALTRCRPALPRLPGDRHPAAAGLSQGSRQTFI